MNNTSNFYINGEWVSSKGNTMMPVINPSTEEQISDIPLANTNELNLAVEAAKNAFYSYSNISLDQKVSIFKNIIVLNRHRIV